MDILVPIIIVGVVALGIAGVIAHYVYERRRREAFQVLAKRLGMRYSPHKNYALADRYAFLDKLRQGDKRYAYNILEGDYEGHPVQVFDYHYQTYSRNSKGHRQTHHHYLSVFVLLHDAFFPELHIYPENFFTRMGQSLGFSSLSISFESNEFSRSFVVRCDDKRFAYDICHTRMMELLLQDRKLSLEIEGNCVAIDFERRLKPHEIEPRLQQLIAIRNQFPEYLYRR